MTLLTNAAYLYYLVKKWDFELMILNILRDDLKLEEFNYLEYKFLKALNCNTSSQLVFFLHFNGFKLYSNSIIMNKLLKCFLTTF